FGNIVNTLFLDGKANLWIATDQGLSVYRPQDDSFEQVTLKDEIGKPYFIDIYALLIPESGKLLVLSNENLYVFEKDNSPNGFQFMATESNSFHIRGGRDMIEDPNGNIWIATES